MQKFKLLYLFVSFSTILFAQKNSFQVYANNGINFSNLVFFKAYTQTYKRDWSSSYRYGVGLKYTLNRKFGISVEYNKEEKGWTQKNTYVLDTVAREPVIGQRNFIYSFTSFPFLFSYHINLKKVSIFIETGASYNKINRSKTGITSTPKNTYGAVFTLTNPQKATDYDLSVLLGVGIEKNIYRRWGIFFNTRYSLSFTKMGTFAYQECCFRHQNFSTLLGVSYKLK